MNPLQSIQSITKQIAKYHPVESISLKKVKSFLLHSMEQLGLNTEEQFFTRMIHKKIYTFSNLIGINPYAQPPYTILCAHVDSPPIYSCPSAIDASASIAIILELYKYLIRTKPDIPLLILFVDGEEAIDGEWQEDNTLSGSTYFAKHISPSLIHKVYVFDLIGGDPIRNRIYAFRDQPHTWSDMKTLSILNKQYKPIIFIDPDDHIENNSPLDDHIPFLQNHMYSMNLIPAVFPDVHHTKYDDYDHVNWSYVHSFFRVWYDFLRDD